MGFFAEYWEWIPSNWKVVLMEKNTDQMACSVWSTSSTLCAGFNWIQRTPFPKIPADQPFILLSNHLTYLDILVHLHLSFCSFVARKETQVIQSVYVDRFDVNSRQKTLDAISDRVKSHQNYDHPLLIFCEGTITNGTAVPKFKVGAFTPGCAFVIALLRYNNPFYNVPWVAKSGLMNMLKMGASPHNSVSITYHTYFPSSQETSDPVLYMNGVRKFFASELGLPMSSYGYHEHVVGIRYYRGDINFEEAEKEIQSLQEQNL
ncbi:hypothetical protein GEMRC1_002084 [Eukaryota sp. GEM-RC1]